MWRVEVHAPDNIWRQSSEAQKDFGSKPAAQEVCEALSNKYPFLEYRIRYLGAAPEAQSVGSAAASPKSSAPSVTAQPHYTTLNPEPITVMEGWTHLSLRMQLALKYLARVGLKGTNEDAIRDCEKLVSYVKREINVRRGKPEW